MPAHLRQVGAPEEMEYTFSDSRFMSARDKRLTLLNWVRFLRRGLREADFTRRIYDHLILHCAFIAHYNRAVFYETYFERGEDTARFLSQFDKRSGCRSVEYGGTWWLQGEYGDLNRAMVEEAAPFIPKLGDGAQRRERASDIAEAKRLLSKHDLQ